MNPLSLASGLLCLVGAAACPAEPPTPNASADATGNADGSEAGGETDSEVQPYGVCKRQCEDDLDCSVAGNIVEGSCDDGFCHYTCNPTACAEESVLGEERVCASIMIDFPGDTYCAVTCDDCDLFVEGELAPYGPEFTCRDFSNRSEPFVCGVDCTTPGFDCTGEQDGSECLPSGGCGCIDDTDCLPGYRCFKSWETWD